MKVFNDAKAEIIKSNMMAPLPVGAYVAKILDAKEETRTFSNGNSVTELVFRLDVAEGEFAGYYKKAYDAQSGSQYGQKWKGIYRLREPQDADKGTDRYKWSMRDLGNFIGCIQDSNPGYKWNWDEKTLKGKVIGICVREFEWETDNGCGVSTEICALRTADDVRNGAVKPFKIRKLKNNTASVSVAAPAPVPVEIPDEEIPF